MRIALCGLAGSGKSTVAEWLERERGFARHRFAKPLKDMMRAFGLTEREIEGDLKEVPCPALLGRTPRHAMVTLGTEWGRDLIHPDLWINAWHRTMPEGDVVTEDLRFRNEWGAAEANRFLIVRIVRPGLAGGAHVSETAIADLRANVQIVNDGTVAELLEKVAAVLPQPDRKTG